jgi:hypothetical protein
MELVVIVIMLALVEYFVLGRELVSPGAGQGLKHLL